MARPEGFEPPIFRIGICCVIQLRHGRKYQIVSVLFSANRRPSGFSRPKHCRAASLGALAALCVSSLCEDPFLAHRARDPRRPLTSASGSAPLSNCATDGNVFL